MILITRISSSNLSKDFEFKSEPKFALFEFCSKFCNILWLSVGLRFIKSALQMRAQSDDYPKPLQDNQT